MLKKVLIANRGEIACRVIATCKRLGIKTVAVFSDADANSQHVAQADEAINIGPPSAAESYLRGDHIIEVAKAVGAGGIHPGYGFLSENAGFSESCAANGIAFIGPPASAIRSMGDKAASKHIMIAAEVPCTGGYHGDDQALETIASESEKIGYPVMLKAVLGGGGKGMRIVKRAEDLPAKLESCQREGQASFGDPRILVEKYIPRSRHIELQVFADTHGNCVHLFERDCSIQRRHQKVLEEAPAPGMTDELRQAMGDAAVNAARAVGYVGAGTVEFMLDVTTNDFYFCEMNTRLQVEHPVSEMITGVDLVEWQLLAASGLAIPLPTQADVNAQFKGHSIEARVYAEDTRGGFMPQAGHLAVVQAPREEEGRLRVETGVRTGDDVSVHYDPMISKLVVWGEDRAAALAKMEKALGEYVIIGPPNNLEFCKTCVRHPKFQAGGVDTAFIEEHETELLPELNTTWPAQGSDAMASVTALGALAVLLENDGGSTAQVKPSLDPTSPFNDAALAGWRVMPKAHATQRIAMRPAGVVDGDDALEVGVVTTRAGNGTFMMSVDGGDAFPVSGKLSAEDGETLVNIDAEVNGYRLKATAAQFKGALHLHLADAALSGRHMHVFDLVEPSVSGDDAASAAPGISAEMPGKVVKFLVEAGAFVNKGDPVVVLEAMKMEHTLCAPFAGTVGDIFAASGDFVDANVDIVVLTKEEA